MNRDPAQDPTASPTESRFSLLPARDAVAALAATAGDEDLAQELFDALLAGLPGELDDLRACVAESDWIGLAEHAHQVRGATRYCGVPALDEAIEALERAARTPDPDRVASGMARVEREAERLQSEAR